MPEADTAADAGTAADAEADTGTPADTGTEADAGSGPDGGTGAGAEDDGSAAEHPAEAPYRAEAVRGDGQWHLTVRSLDHHPDRGEVDAVVVTVTPEGPDDALPEAELDRMLRECGFDRDGAWAPHAGRWATPCHQGDSWAAPPTPPRPEQGHDGSAAPGSSEER